MVSSVSPSSPEASRRLARVRQRDTDIELRLRSILHGMGLRYRLQVPVLTKPRRVADICFPKIRLAVFVDGCFWHGCPIHGTRPKSNAQFWLEKIEANRARDADTDRRLEALGWEVMRVWEHEDPQVVAPAIQRRVAMLKSDDRHRTRTTGRT
ncbi:very short patch repair endonuclease [Ramlibacter sp. MAHUQ-53]|uniref:very short patch repair endonuclease n=1 Tax=unclassified Ramlibacter TaxID=2617605 RepID=UPI0036422D48